MVVYARTPKHTHQTLKTNKGDAKIKSEAERRNKGEKLCPTTWRLIRSCRRAVCALAGHRKGETAISDSLCSTKSRVAPEAHERRGEHGRSRCVRQNCREFALSLSKGKRAILSNVSPCAMFSGCIILPDREHSPKIWERRGDIHQIQRGATANRTRRVIGQYSLFPTSKGA